MKRIFFITGIAAVATTALCLFSMNKYIFAFIAAIVLAAVGLLLFCRKADFIKPALMVLAVSLLFCVRFYFFYNYEVRPVTELQGKAAETQLLLNEVETVDTTQYITAKVVKIANGLPSGFKVQFTNRDENLILAVGDRISAKISYRALSEYSKNSCFSRRIYISGALLEVPEILGHTNTLDARISSLRAVVHKRLFTYLPYDEASLMCGLLLSDTSYMQGSVYDAMRRCGLTHLTAVSGTHLSVFCYSIYRLLQRWLNKHLSAWLTLPSVLLVMAISGFTPSVLRAGLMSILFLVGVGLFKRADALNSLGFAAAAMLISNPFNLLNKGFVLSFCAMIGMVLLVPYFTARIPKPHFKNKIASGAAEYIFSAFICATVASVCTAPASILFFGEISLISPLTNILVTFPAMLAMMLGSVAIFIPFVFYVVKYLLAGIIWITQLLSNLSFASVNATPPYISLWIAATLILFGVMLLLKRLKPALCILLSSALLAVSILSYSLLDTGVVHIAIANTDKGMSVVMAKDSTCIIVGMGGENAKYIVPDYCFSRGIKSIPLVLLPSCEDAYYDIYALNEECYETVLVPPDNTSVTKTLTGIGKTVQTIGEMEITPFENFNLKVVASGGGYVVQWTTEDVTGLVLMGTNIIPQEITEVDYIITDTALPDKYKGGGKTKAFLVSDASNALPIVNSLLNSGMETYLVDTEETAELLIRNGRTVKIDKF